MAEYGALGRYILYRCVVGSRAYGLDTPESDTDRRGFYLPPADLLWSMRGVPEQLEDSEAQECYWEVQKFITLALKANPTVLECLYTPLVETCHPLAAELLTMRQAFLSRQISQTYMGYVRSQFKGMESDMQRGTIRWKHAMHLIRILLVGMTALREGVLEIRVAEEHRTRLMAIRQGELTWAEVNDWRLELQQRFDAAASTTRLPERPDFDRAEAFLLKARRASTTFTGGDLP